MKRPLIVANWKLYVTSKDGAVSRAKALARGAAKIRADFVVCAPSPFIDAVGGVLGKKQIGFGAQAVSVDGDEKRTGEVTARMVASTGASHVIVGHSERRAMGESDDRIAEQVKSILAAKMSPILCIGEQSRDPASGDHFAYIGAQLRASLPQLTIREGKSLVIAYEPVWAIGKAAEDAMSPADLEETVIYIRKVLAELFDRSAALAIPVLYGGSVEPGNAAGLMKGGVSGFLIGHASADPESLRAIAEEAGGVAHDPAQHRGRSTRSRKR